MEKDWFCSEKLTAMAVACVGIAIADPGTIAGGAIAGAGLVGLWKKAKLKDGVGSEELLKRVRNGLREGFVASAEGNVVAEADIRAADKSLERHLADCVPEVEELVETTYAEADFPAYATRMIVDRLAEKDAIFSANSNVRVPVAREFAQVVVHTALREAKSVEPFMQRLVGEVVLLIPQHLQQIEGKLDEQAALIDYLVAREKDRERKEGRRDIAEEHVIELARKIVAKVDNLNDAAQILDKHIEVYLELLAERGQTSNFDEESDAAFERVMALIDLHDFSGALSQGEAEYLRIEEEEKKLAERSAAQKVRMARTNLMAARLCFAPKEAAKWVVELERLERKVERVGVGLLRELSESWYNRAVREGDMLETAIVVELAKLSVEAAQNSRDRNACKIDFALGLSLQGERSRKSSSTPSLTQAEQIYRSVIQDGRSFCTPDELSVVQNNLSLTLRLLSERIENQEEAKSRLQQAIEFSNAAIEGLGANANTEWWAGANENLGLAFLRISQFQLGKKALHSTRNAITALEKSQRVRIASGFSEAWVSVTINLGAAYGMQASLQPTFRRKALRQRAVGMLEQALVVCSIDRCPVLWARAKFNLASILLQLGRSDARKRCENLRRASNEIRDAKAFYDRTKIEYDQQDAAYLISSIDAELRKYCQNPS